MVDDPAGDGSEFVADANVVGEESDTVDVTLVGVDGGDVEAVLGGGGGEYGFDVAAVPDQGEVAVGLVEALDGDVGVVDDGPSGGADDQPDLLVFTVAGGADHADFD
ncbi:hypothetical protein [Nocardia amamiensis]|uniref:hypothetical protein n=1 Tax=Nocardia amamiensis TaxID=404578 RepID=UPI00340A8A9E